MAHITVKRTKKHNAAQKWSLSRTLLAVFMTLLILADLFPLFWLFDFSLLKSGDFFGESILKWPNPPMWKNYADAFTNAHIPLLFFNSVFISFVSIIIIVVIAIMLGYGFTRMEWKLKKPFFGLIIIAMIIPLYSTLIPNFILFKKVGILDTYAALILPYAAFAIPIGMFIISAFLQTIPRAIEEAAIMDGLSIFGTIFRIIIPILRPAIATVAVISFLSCWNEFIMAVTFIDKDALRTLPFAVVYFMGQYSSNYGAQFAVLGIIAIPSIIIYLLFTDQITKGVTTGAVKG
jgi:raffinose/stachyose/melibiose transport system permease protein